MDHGLTIGRTTFFKLQKRLEIPTVRKPGVSEEDIDAAIVAHLATDTHLGQGPKAVKTLLQDGLVFASRDKIKALMKALAPEGFALRDPQRHKKLLLRQPLTSIGPFHEVSADGHEKLNRQALRMGNLSVPIYGYKDKWSGTILQLTAVPDARHAAAVSHIYLDLLDRWEGIPVQLTTDKGSEIGWQTNIQSIFRECYAPEIDSDVFPPSVALKSTQNTVIESCWKWLRDKFGLNIKEVILQGHSQHRFHVNDQEHHYLFYWIFIPLIQEQLDAFTRYWNKHQIRKQSHKSMPSGHIPIDALQHPSLFNGHDCLIRIPTEARDEMRRLMSDEIGPREMHLSWYSPDFDAKANKAYEALGSPDISLETAWVIFSDMANVLAS